MATSVTPKVIYIPAQWSLHDTSGRETKNLPAVKKLLDKEHEAGSRIVVDSPLRTYGPRGVQVFQAFLIQHEIPFHQIGDCADPAITHMLVGDKLIEVC